MAITTLREFLDDLEKDGQLLPIKDEVSLEPDLGPAARVINNVGKDKAPALLFEKPHGYNYARVAMNVHGSWNNHAVMLGMPNDTPIKEQFFEFVRLFIASEDRGVVHRIERSTNE